MDNFALRQIRQREAFNQTPLLAEEKKPPSLEAYRQYVAATENEGTLVSTSQNGVTTAPKTFFGHTLSFLTAKSNAQEVETLMQSLEKNFGPHIAQYAFPKPEQEQAATSQWGGYVQEVTNKTLASALNPTLRAINLDLSLAESEGGPSPAMPFYQRQLHTVVQSAVRELNPTLKSIKLDISLPTAPSVGLSHRLTKQVLERTNTLIANARYIRDAAVTVKAIADKLECLDDEVSSLPQDISILKTNISGLAQDIADHPSPFPQARSLSLDLSTLLTRTTTDIPKTLTNAHKLILETRALAAALKELKEKHNYYELGSSAPINLNAYNFKQFLEPATTLLQEEVTLAKTVVRDLCTTLTSNGKALKLTPHLSKNDRVAKNVDEISHQVSQLKQQLKTALKGLADKAKKQNDDADEIIYAPSFLALIQRTFHELRLGHSLEDEKILIQGNLAFATTTLALITEIERNVEIS
ncbi:MAG: hypothetical protein NT164_06145 [Verrucomicrobiae bacterium]|nr:hypothetical protein [Verrucomicrobiae bacterium]